MLPSWLRADSSGSSSDPTGRALTIMVVSFGPIDEMLEHFPMASQFVISSRRLGSFEMELHLTKMEPDLVSAVPSLKSTRSKLFRQVLTLDFQLGSWEIGVIIITPLSLVVVVDSLEVSGGKAVELWRFGEEEVQHELLVGDDCLVW